MVRKAWRSGLKRGDRAGALSRRGLHPDLMGNGPQPEPGEPLEEEMGQATFSPEPNRGAAGEAEAGAGEAPTDVEGGPQRSNEESSGGEVLWGDEYPEEACGEGEPEDYLGSYSYEGPYVPENEAYPCSGPDAEPTYYAYPAPAPYQRGKQLNIAGPWPRLVTATALAVVAAAVALAVTAARSSTPLALPGASTGKLGSTPASAHEETSTTVARTSTTLQHKPTSTAQDRKLVKNLVISAPTKQSLLTTWLASDPGGVGLSAKDVAGTAPGQVYYAYDASISTYFAVVAFQPSSSLFQQAPTPTTKAKLLQLLGYDYVFSLQTGSTWALLGFIPKGYCPGVWVPVEVLAVWGMCGFPAHT
jgi:hypothetical protein